MMERNRRPDPTLGTALFLWIGLLIPLGFLATTAPAVAGVVAGLWTVGCAYSVLTGHVRGRQRRPLRKILLR